MILIIRTGVRLAFEITSVTVRGSVFFLQPETLINREISVDASVKLTFVLQNCTF